MPDPRAEEIKRACANYLGINPSVISSADYEHDGGGHITGLRVSIFIPASRTRAHAFVDKHKDAPSSAPTPAPT